MLSKTNATSLEKSKDAAKVLLFLPLFVTFCHILC